MTNSSKVSLTDIQSETAAIVNPNERVDDLRRGGLFIIQNPDFFCFGMDAVLFTSFIKVGKSENVLDLCSGNGIIPILLTAKTQGKAFHGLEIAPENVELAMRSVRLNNLSGKIFIHEGDVRRWHEYYRPASFDVVTVNPPYMSAGGGLLNVSNLRATARHEILCTLEDVVSAGAGLLKTSGRFYMVHRPHRLVDIFCALRGHSLEPKTLRLVHPYADREPILVMVEAVRNGKSSIKIKPPLVVYDSDGRYTAEVDRIYNGD